MKMPGPALLLIFSLCLVLAGCQTEQPMTNTVEQVIYTADSGPVLPELQWHEERVITRTAVTLTRNGRVAATQINAGAWAVPVDAAALLDELAAVDCASLTRVEPADPPDGGGTVSYTLVFADGDPCVLTFDPGVTYTGSEAITAPVQALLQTLPWPPEAASRIK